MQTLTSTLLTASTAKKGSVIDRVKSFEDACRELDMVPSQLSITGENVADDDLQAATNFYKLIIITKALNGNWVPDFSNKKQAKYYPWFEYKEGTGFVLRRVNYCYDFTSVGARLCFETRELAEHAASLKEYNDYLLSTAKIKLD